jgi:hypothetical protein
MKYGFLGPAGSNLNYIGQVFTGEDVKPILAYHDNDNGAHSAKKDMKFKIWPLWNSDCELHVQNPEYKIIQILCKKQHKFLLLNWFEKNSRRPQSAYPFIDEWRTNQLEAWSVMNVDEDSTLARAVLHWFYKINDKDNEELKDVGMIKNKFSFDVFYENDPYLVSKQFNQYGIEYTTEMYNRWKKSQKIIFDSYEHIEKNLSNPLNLEVYWHRGIAIGINGLANNLEEQEAWEKFYG